MKNHISDINISKTFLRYDFHFDPVSGQKNQPMSVSARKQMQRRRHLSWFDALACVLPSWLWMFQVTDNMVVPAHVHMAWRPMCSDTFGNSVAKIPTRLLLRNCNGFRYESTTSNMVAWEQAHCYLLSESEWFGFAPSRALHKHQYCYREAL